MSLKILKEIQAIDGSVISVYMVDELGEILSFEDVYKALDLVALLNKNSDSKTTYTISKDGH
jgi:hypothetical protein|tara:strand:- start:530 stop:715 length:186 start_codon:yes stop_codon:yes gene_type:complete